LDENNEPNAEHIVGRGLQSFGNYLEELINEEVWTWSLSAFFRVIFIFSCVRESCNWASFWSPNPAQAQHLFLKPDLDLKAKLPSESKFAQLW